MKGTGRAASVEVRCIGGGKFLESELRVRRGGKGTLLIDSLGDGRGAMFSSRSSSLSSISSSHTSAFCRRVSSSGPSSYG